MLDVSARRHIWVNYYDYINENVIALQSRLRRINTRTVIVEGTEKNAECTETEGEIRDRD